VVSSKKKIKQVSFEPSPERGEGVRPTDVYEKCLLGRRRSECRGPETGVCLRNS
jgi:hypothetical protein